MSAVLKFKDGDDNLDGTNFDTVVIKIVSNGYIVVWEDDDGTLEEVYTSKETLMMALEEEL